MYEEVDAQLAAKDGAIDAKAATGVIEVKENHH